jgi:hypothetical protein
LFNFLKTELSEFIGLSKDALHVHLGLLVFLLAMVIFRRSAASLVPWACVLALQVGNELIDTFHWYNGVLEFNLAGSLKDMVNTMLWPTLILLLARYTRLLGSSPKSGAPLEHTTAPSEEPMHPGRP